MAVRDEAVLLPNPATDDERRRGVLGTAFAANEVADEDVDEDEEVGVEEPAAAPGIRLPRFLFDADKIVWQDMRAEWKPPHFGQDPGPGFSSTPTRRGAGTESSVAAGEERW